MTDDHHNNTRENVRTIIPWVMVFALVMYGTFKSEDDSHEYIRALQKQVTELEKWVARNQARLDAYDARAHETLDIIQQATEEGLVPPFRKQQ